MEMNEIWNCEKPVAELLNCEIPDWIEQDICAATIASIVQGGCNSGAYMPAVTYYTALRTMTQWGDEVLQYIEDAYGEIPQPEKGESWSGMACYYLSMAVELWAGSILWELEALESEEEEEEQQQQQEAGQ